MRRHLRTTTAALIFPSLSRQRQSDSRSSADWLRQVDTLRFIPWLDRRDGVTQLRLLPILDCTMRSGKEKEKKRDSLVCFSDNNFFWGGKRQAFLLLYQSDNRRRRKKKSQTREKQKKFGRGKKNPECFNGIEHVCRSLYKREKLLSPQLFSSPYSSSLHYHKKWRLVTIQLGF